MREVIGKTTLDAALTDGRIQIQQDVTNLLQNPSLWIVPGAAISLFVLAVNFFGDGLRDVMDPRQQ